MGILRLCLVAVVASSTVLAGQSAGAGAVRLTLASRTISATDHFYIQFAGVLDRTKAAQVYEVDGEDTPASVVADLHARGKVVVCYISAGSWENYRKDAGAFPTSVLGNTLGGWPDEKWLDIRQTDILLPIMDKRMDMCVAKGFDGVEFDNVDGYSNNTGFPLTKTQQVTYDRALAADAHARGLQPGLKNAISMIPSLVGDFDWALNEQCVQYSECRPYKAFINAGKPVFNLEYNVSVAKMCKVTLPLGIYPQKKKLSLSAWRRTCGTA